MAVFKKQRKWIYIAFVIVTAVIMAIIIIPKLTGNFLIGSWESSDGLRRFTFDKNTLTISSKINSYSEFYGYSYKNNILALQSNNETICTDTVPECTTGTAVGTQQINQKNDFDIVDFVISHSDERSVRKKSKLPKILLCVILGVLIIGMCVMFAVWSSLSHKNKLWGTWQTSGGITMTITEKNITINGKTSEYIIEEKNVIAIKMNNE